MFVKMLGAGFLAAATVVALTVATALIIAAMKRGESFTDMWDKKVATTVALVSLVAAVFGAVVVWFGHEWWKASLDVAIGLILASVGVCAYALIRERMNRRERK